MGAFSVTIKSGPSAGRGFCCTQLRIYGVTSHVAGDPFTPLFGPLGAGATSCFTPKLYGPEVGVLIQFQPALVLVRLKPLHRLGHCERPYSCASFWIILLAQPGSSPYLYPGIMTPEGWMSR